MDGSQISGAALRALALNSREKLIREQREDPELGYIYRYIENPDDGSFNTTVCEGWSQDFKLIDGLLFYAKYFTTLGELRVYIPKSLREAIMQEFHDLPLAGHLGKRKTYLKIDIGPQFISEVFEHLSHRLDIKHIKTVTYRPQANLTESVNRTLVQMIACFVEENHDNWDLFLHEFAFVLRTSVNETTVNIDQVRVYHARQSDTISFDSQVETLYEGQRSSNGSSRSHPGKSKGSRKTSSEESRDRKSNKGNTALEDPRLKRKSIAGPSHQLDTRQCKLPTEESRQGARGQYDRARETRKTPSKGNSAAERRPVRSRQATALRPCPYYLRSRLKKPKGIPEEQRSNGIDSLPQNHLRRRSLSMEALDGDPVDRSE
ncbi:uncharacterized protein TNCV_1751541 [Trichonephila clavipes]|nr:uncharacterized protein TNCV_1751541 [Trichonephila clavipes]